MLAATHQALQHESGKIASTGTALPIRVTFGVSTVTTAPERPIQNQRASSTSRLSRQLNEAQPTPTSVRTERLPHIKGRPEG
jgi:hypothetical protein